jgi:hypothetical protein
MHRFVTRLLDGDTDITAYYPTNEQDILPWCEPHVVYDLIRGFMRNAHDDKGEKELYHGLKLLLRSYGNVRELLTHQFDKNHVFDNRVQTVIKKVLKQI